MGTEQQGVNRAKYYRLFQMSDHFLKGGIAFPAMRRQTAILAGQRRQSLNSLQPSRFLFFPGLGVVLLACALESNEGSAAA